MEQCYSYLDGVLLVCPCKGPVQLCLFDGRWSLSMVISFQKATRFEIGLSVAAADRIDSFLDSCQSMLIRRTGSI
jgi:hypothetical protein